MPNINKTPKELNFWVEKTTQDYFFVGSDLFYFNLRIPTIDFENYLQEIGLVGEFTCDYSHQEIIYSMEDFLQHSDKYTVCCIMDDFIKSQNPDIIDMYSYYLKGENMYDGLTPII